MASTLPPVKNAAFTFLIALVSQADTDIFKTSPTLAAGDITISKDGGNFANIGTLPTQIQTTGVLPVALTADEMNADIVTVLFHDAAGAEWQDALVTIYTGGQTLDTIEGLVDDIGVAGAGLTAIPTIAAVTTVANVTGAVGSVTGSVGSVVGLTASNLDATISSRAPSSTALSNTTLADSVPADGTRPTPEQALYAIYCYLLERAVSDTTVTVNKVDGSTALMTLTINDASAPTSITRTT